MYLLVYTNISYLPIKMICADISINSFLLHFWNFVIINTINISTFSRRIALKTPRDIVITCTADLIIINYGKEKKEKLDFYYN